MVPHLTAREVRNLHMMIPTEASLYLRQISAGLDPDFLRDAVRVTSAMLMEIEVKHDAICIEPLIKMAIWLIHG
jgi:hypothetical protein